MILIEKTTTFDKWLHKLKDPVGKARILTVIKRVELGRLELGKSVGNRISEFRIDHGPGYRLYFTRKGDRLIWLLCGGTKSSQARDIQRAQDLLRQLEL